MTPGIIVHGGAGAGGGPDRIGGCAAAAARGLAVLAGGGSALDAAVAAVRVLEDDPRFNAGLGSVLTRDGTVEVDAAVMDGAGLRAGAVGAVPDLGNAINLARAVMDDGEHVLLVGEAAWRFAGERGFVRAAPGALITERARASLQNAGGTVGACAIDAAGHVAAATSTGGLTGKRPGRVGDTPLPGCGTYADDAGGAASATGHGEPIIRVTLTRLAVDVMRAGGAAEDAARTALDELRARTGAVAGIICVDRRGGFAAARTTEVMPVARATLTHPTPITSI